MRAMFTRVNGRQVIRMKNRGRILLSCKKKLVEDDVRG